MLEVLNQDYVRTAKAKGVGQRAILFVHALKNAAVPIITTDPGNCRGRLMPLERRINRERLHLAARRPAA